MANIWDKGIKKAFKDLKEEMGEDKMHKQNENMNKEIENLKRNKKFLSWKVQQQKIHLRDLKADLYRWKTQKTCKIGHGN